MPEWFDELPPAEPGDDFYMAAFWELDTERSYGMGIGPIPWSTMVMYAQFHGLEPDIAEGFVQIIREMDGIYLKWKSDEMKAKEEEDRRRSPQSGEEDGGSIQR